MVELPPCPSPHDAEDRHRHAGWPLVAEGHKFGGAARDRWYFMNPAIREPVPISERAPTYQLENGCKWPAPGVGVDKIPTLRAVWPLIIDRVRSNEAYPSELGTLEGLNVTSPLGTRVLAGPFESARWLGFSVEQTRRMMARFPCMGKIGTLSGLAPTAKTQGKEPMGTCGVQRLRVPCCTVV